jgi:hypothetical protein
LGEVGSRKWKVRSGKWEAGSGKLEVGSGEWGVGNVIKLRDFRLKINDS